MAGASRSVRCVGNGVYPLRVSEEVLKKVHDWLERNGYPLEYETQHAFDEAGIGSVQGYHVKDLKTDAVREIDVLASIQRIAADGRFIQCTHVVECKQNGKPWVAFTRPIGARAGFCIEQTIGNVVGKQAASALANDLDLQRLDLFRRRSAPAFGGSEAKLGESGAQDANAKDGCYAKLQAVVSNSVSLAGEFHDEDHATMIFPVIVLGGALFTASYDMKARKLAVAEADEVRFQWRGAEALSAGHATIDVVTAKHLPKWAEQRRRDVDAVLRKLAALPLPGISRPG